VELGRGEAADERQALAERAARIEVGRERDGAPASTSARAGGIGRSRKRALAGSRTPTTSLAASARAGLARRLEVVDRPGAELDRERDRSELVELIAVQPQRETRVTTGLEVAARLSTVNAPSSTNTSAASASARPRARPRQHEVEVSVRVLELRRHSVRAEPRRHAAGAERAQRRELGLAVEPVSRLASKVVVPACSIQPRCCSTAARSSLSSPSRVARTVERIPPPAACSSS
jgi:hypothetical protein